MANKKTKLTVGLFVITGLILAVLAVIWLGMSHLFEDGRLFSAYFDESVQGLQKDSPVKYRGVSIGRVDSINVAPDGKLIEVIMNIESSLKKPDEVVGQLKSVGITGLVFIELEHPAPDEPDASPTIDFSTRYPVIATRTSNMANIIEEFEDLLKRSRQFDFAGISNDFKFTAAQINRAIKETELIDLARDLRTTVNRAGEALDPQEIKKFSDAAMGIRDDVSTLTKNANKTVDRLNTLISSSETDIHEAIEDFRHSVKTADTLMSEGIDLIGNTETGMESLQNRIYVTANHLERASISLSRLIDSINREPSQLLFGNQPAPKKIEE